MTTHVTPTSTTQAILVGDNTLLQLVSFQVGAEEYAVDILTVQEIIRTQALTRVPNLPDFVEGVLNLRGKVIPVVGLRRCFGLDVKEDDKHSRVAVVEVNGVTIGFIVDGVSEVLRIPRNTIEPPPTIGQRSRDYVTGIAKLESRLVLLLDLDRLLSEAEQSACVAVVEEAD